MSRHQRDQEFSIPGFPGRDFAQSRDPRIFRDGISLKFLSRDFPKKEWEWANLTNYMSSDGEFRCCHLAFGVFRPKIYVYIEELWVKSLEFPKMTIQIICYLNFRKVVNMVGERKTAAHEFPKMKITNYLYRHFRKFANRRLSLPAHSVPT